jgi:hypothetical protein
MCVSEKPIYFLACPRLLMAINTLFLLGKTSHKRSIKCLLFLPAVGGVICVTVLAPHSEGNKGF